MSNAKLSALAILAAVMAPPLLAQQSVEAFHVQGHVHLLLGAGANVAVQIGEEGILVVDTGAAADRDAVLAAIRRLSDQPIRWIINTSVNGLRVFPSLDVRFPHPVDWRCLRAATGRVRP